MPGTCNELMTAIADGNGNMANTSTKHKTEGRGPAGSNQPAQTPKTTHLPPPPRAAEHGSAPDGRRVRDRGAGQAAGQARNGAAGEAGGACGHGPGSTAGPLGRKV